MKPTRRAIALSAIVGSVILGLSIARVAAFPDRPVEYIIPFGPGGESDISAQLQQPYFSEKFGQDLVISYKPGAGGAVGWSELNDLPGDGHTIMGVNLPHIAIQPAVKNVGYQTEELVPIYWFHYTPDAIVVRADSEFLSVFDLIAFAEENPGQLTWSGSGTGTANHLAHVTFNKLAGIETTYVPFKGTGAAVKALMGQQVMAQWGYTTVGAAQGDRVRLLAVAMDERHPLFPDVPTFRELGFDMVGGAYRGVAVPASTSEETRLRWAEMIGAINKDPDFRQQMAEGGFAVFDQSYETMNAFIKERIDFYRSAAAEAGVL